MPGVTPSPSVHSGHANSTIPKFGSSPSSHGHNPFQHQLSDYVHALSNPLLLGYLLNWGLQGILTVQVYTYYMSFPKDKRRMKLLVYGIFAVDVAQTLMTTHDAIVIYASGFGDQINMTFVHLIWMTVPIIGGAVGFVAQCFFAHRIYILSRSFFIAGLVVFLGLCATAAAMVSGVHLLMLGQVMRGLNDPIFLISTGVWNGCGALCDMIIAVCMTYYLAQSETGFSGTHFLLNRLIRLTIETGIVTASAAIATVVLYVGFREDLSTSAYFAIPAISIAKLYSISILAIFNSRLYAVPEGETPGFETISPNDILFASVKPKRKWSLRGQKVDPNLRTSICIERHVEQQIWTDEVAMRKYSASSESEIQGYEKHLSQAPLWDKGRAEALSKLEARKR